MKSLERDANLDLHLTPGAPDECWEWRGEKSPKGYGIVYAKERGKWRRRKAHRVAHERAHGPTPHGLCVLHHCDNPRHLFLGTRLDNNRDRAAKRRGRHSVLTFDDAEEIRFLRSQGVSWSELAAEYSISLALVEDIVCRLKWKRPKPLARSTQTRRGAL